MLLDVFIFNPRYIHYPTSGTPQHHTLLLETVRTEETNRLVEGSFLYIALGVAFTFPICYTLWSLADAGQWLGFIILLMLILVFLRHVWQTRREALAAVKIDNLRYHRLITPGVAQILQGEILSSQVDTIGGRGPAIYRTSITYQFETPTGKIMTGTQSRREKVDTPPAGAPVRILYADDDAYVML